MAQTARAAMVMLGLAGLLLASCTREKHNERPVLPSASPTPVPTPTTSPLPAPTATPDPSALPSPTMLPSPSPTPAPTAPPAPELACVAVMNHCSCKFICIPASDRARTDCARACPQERSVLPPKCSGKSGQCEIVP